MAKLYNLARMTTATTGTGTITLGSAVSSYLSFASSGVLDGETVTYAIADGSNREIGRGVYTASGTTLTRTVLESTNSNTAINLSGNAEVFITAAAEDITSNVEITGGSITGITDLAIADGGTGKSTASAAANALDSYLGITSAGGTTTLTNTSARTIVVTGTSAQTIVLPDVTTLALGWSFIISNTTNNIVTVQSSGGNSFPNTLTAGLSARLVCVAITGTTTASWAFTFIGSTGRTGTGSLVYNGTPTITTPLIAQVSGGSAVSSTLTLQSTSGAGTTDSIIFRTASQSERFRIDTSGALGIGGANYGTSTQYMKSGGTGAAPSWATLAISDVTNLQTSLDNKLDDSQATAFGLSLLDDVDAAAGRTTLGLGTLATQSGTFSGTSSGTNTGDQNLFSTIAVSGQSNVVADTTSDTLTLVAGTNVTITTDATTDSITIAASSGTSSGSLLRAPQILTTGTSYTTPAGCNTIYIELVGAGAGGASGSAATYGGGGGGAGSYAAKYFTVSPSTSYTYAIGAAGGATGGSTTFTVGATTVTAGGGSRPASSGGGVGGTSTNGDINVRGGHGGPGATVSQSAGGSGGASFFGSGGGGGTSGSAGTTALVYGGGGGGGAFGSNSGGSGMAGVIRVWEYS